MRVVSYTSPGERFLSLKENEVYAMLRKVVSNNSKHTIATPENGDICYNTPTDKSI
jgi:hypothetical protein